MLSSGDDLVRFLQYLVVQYPLAQSGVKIEVPVVLEAPLSTKMVIELSSVLQMSWRGAGVDGTTIKVSPNAANSPESAFFFLSMSFGAGPRAMMGLTCFSGFVELSAAGASEEIPILVKKNPNVRSSYSSAWRM